MIMGRTSPSKKKIFRVKKFSDLSKVWSQIRRERKLNKKFEEKYYDSLNVS